MRLTTNGENSLLQFTASLTRSGQRQRLALDDAAEGFIPAIVHANHAVDFCFYYLPGEARVEYVLCLCAFGFGGAVCDALQERFDSAKFAALAQCNHRVGALFRVAVCELALQLFERS